MISTTRSSRSLLALALAALLVLSALPPTARAAQELEGGRFAPGEVLIGWAPGRGPVQEVRPQTDAVRPDATQPDWQTALRELQAETGLVALDARPDYGAARLRVREGREAEEIARLRSLPWVRYAEPNYIAHAAGVTAVYPNDPAFAIQWHMHRVEAPEAWAMIRGSQSFAIAVLDTGVSQGHAEFAGHLLSDRDYDYVNNDYDPEDDDPESHGTHVTGIIVAGFNNGQGVAGLAPDVKVLPYKVLNQNRDGYFATISQAIRDAANSDAQVINLSLVGYDYSQTLLDAVNYAIGRGRLVVAAAGNCPMNTSCGPNTPNAYPAAFPGVLAVGASDRYDQPAPYAIPKPYVGIAAPGGSAERGVWSTTRSSYGYMAGTSVSAPMVSAAAALVWTLRPAAPPGEIAQILKNTADKVGTFAFSGDPLPYIAGRNDIFGAGRLNVGKAVRQVYPPALSNPGPQSFFLAGSRTSASQTLSIRNPSDQAIWWQATVMIGASWLSTSPPNGTAVFSAPGELALSAKAGSLGPGLYSGQVRLTALAPPGVSSVDIPVQLTVAANARRAYAPLVGVGFGREWYDPDAPGAIHRLELNLTGDGIAQMVLPFPVRFYGAQQQLIQVSENGLVTFGAGNVSVKPPAYCPGNGAGPNNALYVFGADWVADGEASVLIHQADPNTFAVTWRNVRLNGTPSRATFQLAIDRWGEFRGNYRAAADPRAGMIGSENDDATIAERILCERAGRPAPVGGSVIFTPAAPWQ